LARLRSRLDEAGVVHLRNPSHIVPVMVCDPVLCKQISDMLDLTRFLHIAVGLAAALRRLHRRGLVHKDIEPANLFVDADDKVRLTGFGAASRLPRDCQAPAAPEVIAGTFAWPRICDKSAVRKGRSRARFDASCNRDYDDDLLWAHSVILKTRSTASQ
jgi:serine/threonine protein kinase